MVTKWTFFGPKPGGIILGRKNRVKLVFLIVMGFDYNSVSCFGSTFTINSPTTTINCGSDFSCGYGTINASGPINNSDSLQIICDQQSSCIQTQINVERMSAFTLDCMETNSCSQMKLTLTRVLNSSITCYKL